MLPGFSNVLLLSSAPIFVLTISADTTNYVIRTALVSAGWNGVEPIGWVLTINTGIYVRATSTSGWGLDTGDPLPSGSGPFLITNLGYIQGKGGAAGNGGTSSSNAPTIGLPGGAAMRIKYGISIANGSGYILGGGGGGAGGRGDTATTGGKGGSSTNYGGGGGGGGAGTGPKGLKGGALAADGTDGTNINPSAANGTGGARDPGGPATQNGGNGGDWGAAGTTTTVAGGAAGKAIETGGNSVNFLSGGSAPRVLGAVS